MLPLLLVVSASPAPQDPAPEEPPPVDPAEVRAAAALVGLELTDPEVELMLPDLAEHRAAYERLRAAPLPNDLAPAFVFEPLPAASELAPPPALALEWPAVRRPDDLDELCYADVVTMAALVRAREVSCVELVETHLARLRRIDETLHCVVTLTEERALAQARELDRELDAGRWRGPLHGIPWGAKDLLATAGGPTTWGAATHRDQVLDEDAEVVRRLDEAGAVLVAKLTLGALAWGDVWFGGRTRNPWNPEQGSSGSSAGSAAATAAGGVAFAIGSETLGSIVSPSERCGTSSLRPTFGRVSRRGAMALSWTMDKLGPLCRSARDADLVFRAIEGRDPADPWSRDRGRRGAPPAGPALAGKRVGVPRGAFAEDDPRRAVLDGLRELGAELVEVEVPSLVASEATLILQAEAACVFDELVRTNRDDELTRQERYAWPNVFRHAQLVPAVEYLRASRHRTRLLEAMQDLLADVDLLVHPSFHGDLLSVTNLTGHPTAVVPAGFREDGTPFGVSFTGRLFRDEELLAAVWAWQRTTGHHRRHPGL